MFERHPCYIFLCREVCVIYILTIFKPHNRFHIGMHRQTKGYTFTPIMPIVTLNVWGFFAHVLKLGIRACNACW